MKNLFLSIAFLFIFSASFSQSYINKKVKSNISDVKVYLNNAEITRNKKIVLPAGNTRIVFTGLSPELQANSVRFKITPEVSILQITVITNYLENEKIKPKIKVLNDSLSYVYQKIQDIKDELAAYKSALDVLNKNKSIGGQNNGVALNSLKLAVDYYTSENIKLNKKITKLRRQRGKLDIKKSNLLKQKKELNAKPGTERKEVELLVSSETARTCLFSLKYLVNNAGWSPIYDIKVQDTDKPIRLIYKAQVYNNTQIDWKNTPLTLSINNPNLSNTKPELATWFIKPQVVHRKYYSQKRNIQQKKSGKRPKVQMNQSEDFMDIEFSEDKEADNKVTIPDYTENKTYVPVLSFEFKIADKYNIPSDNKPYLITISKEKLNAVYKLYSVPKIDKRVFLLSQITGWQQLNLIAGQANIYYAGSYIGRSFISISTMNDTLDISLGPDAKVVILRKKLNQLSSTKFIGNKKTVTFAYEFTVKNNHKSNIHIQIKDQIPISQNKDIEVKSIELNNGELNKTTGIIKWNLFLKAGETKKIKFVFSIKYPKNMNVPMQKMKNVKIRYYQ